MRPLLSILLLFAVVAAPSGTFTANVVEILDGDTIRTKSPDGIITTIRLDGIDAPEKGQPFSNVSQKIVGDLIFQKDVTVNVVGHDKYQRTLARITVDGKAVNTEMVKRGMAWHYVQYAPMDTDLANAELFARKSKAGLWSDPKPIAPWEWRDGAKAEGMAKGAPNPNTKEDDVTVHVTKNGNKYHRAGCRYLSGSDIPMPLSRARSAYTPCSVCKPEK